MNKSFDSIIKFINQYDESNNLSSKLDKLKGEKKVYSDIVGVEKDDDGLELQYVNIVQEGGGTLGIALLGFCFVLEYMGIRFMRLAGTSAGAINTLFMASIGEKHEPKTPELFSILEELNMMEFVDGHPFVKMMVKSLISKDGWIAGLFVAFVVMLLLLVFVYPFFAFITNEANLFYLLTLIIFSIFLGYGIYLYIRIKKANYGMNPGVFFQKEFLEKKLSQNGIQSKKQLDNIAYKKYNLIKKTVNGNATLPVMLRPGIVSNCVNIIADYSFIAADIYSEQKVQFPLNANLYWNDVDQINPSNFVRASMAIPLFFEPLIIPISSNEDKIINSWKEVGVEPEKIPNKGVFVDGGTLSNFPINIFHDPDIKIPRLPTIGIRLQEEEPKPITDIENIGDYMSKIINTMRNHLDKDFLKKHNFYEKRCIADIETWKTKANWLDFNMSVENKAALFLKGVESGLTYLEKFDWEIYKKEREELYNLK